MCVCEGEREKKKIDCVREREEFIDQIVEKSA